ncbi:MAG: TIGR00730 family Rossman fold protein [Alphaproteobacteria bacterium]|nr:TIGR00730 family Rossman fold protein [Alphaproteobacteria bacterium]
MDNSKPVICVFCGSSHGSDAGYARDARRFGALLAAHGFDMVFGGGYIGLMGEVAHAAREGGAYITGVLPDFLRHLEPPSHDAHRMIVTADLTERKKLMLSLADGFAVLPGGLGTLDEFFEVITAAQLNVFDKPLVVLDTDGFYAPLDALIDKVVAEDFAGARVRTLYRRAPTPEQAIEHLAARVRRTPPG